MNNEPIETQAVVVHEPEKPMPLAKVEQQAITSAQAKIDAVASVTMAAYAKASQLVLSAEEVNALKADFPDEAFKPGAAGKEQLLYCEHAFLRDRLDTALGMGQWTLVPRNRWAEPFKTNAGKDGSRVYFEGMLMVRGCFVAEAVGEMEYYPHNAAQNYGDAVEGAETACLRRCCKKWGIGLQAWKKDWCDGWWQRKRRPVTNQRSTPPSTKPEPAKAAPAPTQEVKKASSADILKQPEVLATEKTKEWALGHLRSLYSDEILGSYAEAKVILMPGENVDSWPLHRIPTSKDGMNSLLTDITKWIKSSAPETGDPEDPDAPNAKWRSFTLHFGKDKGTTLADLDKKTLFGWWANYEPKPYNGKIAEKDEEFREMLDMAGEHYEFEKG